MRNIWKNIVPARLRNRIVHFTVTRDTKLKLKTLTKKLIQSIEDGSVNFNKAAEILKFLKTKPDGMMSPDFFKIWTENHDHSEICFNFNGALLPYIKEEFLKINGFHELFIDTFFFHVMLNDNYDKKFVNFFENDMPEGPYGYTDGTFDVSVKSGDTVIDAGSFIGDFAAYAAARGAYTYAFEPTDTTFSLLKKTVELNNGKIFPVKKGLGNIDGEVEMFFDDEGPSSNTINVKQGDVSSRLNNKFMISITTLDKFAADNGLKKIDFIKADIEGAERDMLRGAKTVLKEFAPKLAICTYHLPDDPKVLESLILEANPRYKVRQGP
ncbi:MAG: FkbM family methyltransferase, partial [Spirochaetaceae bacterium]|nr:FkbM family methyltransferase [Spirochaetaceae bacterium]